MKKMVSILLVLCLSVSLLLPVGAVNNEQVEVIQDNEVSEIQFEDGSIVKAEELLDGTAKFTEMKDGKVIAEAVLDRERNVIIDTTYQGNSKETEYIDIQGQKAVGSLSSARAAGSYQRCGAITYNFYGGNDHVTGTRKLDVYNMRSYVAGTKYNVTGSFKSKASFISYIAGILAVPVGVANPLAGSILNKLSIVVGTAGFVVPNHWVKCDKTTMTWKGVLSDARDVYGTFTGTQYAVTGETNKTYVTGDFWSQVSYASRSKSFATHLYNKVMGQDIVEIVKWE